VYSLGIDMDGCLYNFQGAVLEYFRLYKGYTGTYGEFWSKDKLKLSDADWEFLINIDILYTSEMPTPDCINFLNYVKYRFNIYYITARPLLVKLTTEQYMRRHNFPFRDNLIFEKDKVNTARRLKLDYFIDDSQENIAGLSKVTNAILMAQPENRAYWDIYPTIHSLMGAVKLLKLED
jgi:hypothetical protein